MELNSVPFGEITLTPLSALSRRRYAVINRAVRASYDVSLGGFRRSSGWMRSLADVRGAWVVMLDQTTPVGVIALRDVESRQGWLQTTTLIFSEYRGAGINAVLKRAIAIACHEARLPLGIFVRPENIRSQRAMANAFPWASPVLEEVLAADGTLERHRYFYDLSCPPEFLVVPECAESVRAAILSLAAEYRQEHSFAA